MSSGALPLVLDHFQPFSRIGELPGAAVYHCQDVRDARHVLGLRVVAAELPTTDVVAPLLRFLEVDAAVLPPLARGRVAAPTAEAWLMYAIDPRQSVSAVLAAGDALDWLRGVALALEPLHAQGVAHGSLQRSLVGRRQGRVVLAGYGVSALCRRVPLKPAEAARLAPELRSAERGQVLPSVDAYALGMLARELLPPAGINDAVRLLLDGALGQAPEDRPADLRAWVEALAGAYEVAEPNPETASPSNSGELSSASSALRRSGAEGSADQKRHEPQQLPEAGRPELPGSSAARPPGAAPPPTGTLRDGVPLVATLTLILGGVLMLAVLGLGGYAVLASRGVASPAARALPAPPTPSAAVPTPLRPAPHGTSGVEVRLALPKRPGTASPGDAEALLPVSSASPIWGDAEALVTAVLFGDLNCPFTRYTFRTLGKIQESMPLSLRLVFRHRPLSEQSRKLASFAVRLHAEHGAPVFYRFLDSISRERHPRDVAYARHVGEDLGLTATQVERLLESGEHARQLGRDEAWALRYAVRRTPTLFVNGERLEGLATEEQLRELIERERRAQVSALAMGVPPGSLYRRRVDRTLIGLGAEPPERLCVPVQGAPRRMLGERPSVTIVQFSDYECAYCAQLSRTLQRVSRRFPSQLSIVHRHFPLERHPEARAAANLALHGLSAGDQTTFWQLHDALLAEHARLGDSTYRSLLARLKLNVDDYMEAVARGAHDASINRDLEIGEELGVSGVPTLFVNGRKLEGARDAAALHALLSEEIAAMKRLAGLGWQASEFAEALCEGERP